MFEVSTPYEEAIPLYRPPQGETSYLLTSPGILSVRTHWFGQSLMCPGDDICEACAQDWQSTVKLYLGCIVRGGKQGILELPLSAASRLERLMEEIGLVGRILVCKRSASRSPAVVYIDPDGERMNVVERDKDALIDQLARIYGLPRRRDFKDLGLWRTDLKEKARRKLSIALQRSLALDSKSRAAGD